MKVAFCVPSLKGPTPQFVKALEESLPAIDAAGIEHAAVEERGCPYISNARATMLHKAMEWGADAILFLDYDLSWGPTDLLTLIQAEGDVVAGTYRFKQDKERYMGSLLADDDGKPLVRADGCVEADMIPAGFLKVTRGAIDKLKAAHPELIYGGDRFDLFNHGAFEGLWWGEDYAFSRRWCALGEKIWIIPDLNLTHWNGETPFEGNFHQFLLKQPGGRDAPPVTTSEYLQAVGGDA